MVCFTCVYAQYIHSCISFLVAGPILIKAGAPFMHLHLLCIALANQFYTVVV